eukprot:TRINITY_DN1370_c0_g1_i1.p1 TRINITY_DN1370_c0_g1~~TRINITY_DN1370_c0_g1_i1.p1  ORF type:complete len:932 (+),score=418.30 TRINITY_DN1370_c0_g1_i1:331-2796(+)
MSSYIAETETQEPDEAQDRYPIKFAFTSLHNGASLDMLSKTVQAEIPESAKWGDQDHLGSRYMYTKKFTDLAWMVNKQLINPCLDDARMNEAAADITYILNIGMRPAKGAQMAVTLVAVAEKHTPSLKVACDAWPTGVPVRKGDDSDMTAPVISKALSQCSLMSLVASHPASVSGVKAYYKSLADTLVHLGRSKADLNDPPPPLQAIFQKINEGGVQRTSSLVPGGMGSTPATQELGSQPPSGGGKAAKTGWGKVKKTLIADTDVKGDNEAVNQAAKLLLSAGKKQARSRGEELLETEVMKLRQEAAETSMKLGVINRDLQQRSLDVTRLQNELDSKIRQIRALTDELDDMTKQRDFYRQKVDTVDVTGLEEELEKLRKDLEEAMAALNDLQRRYAALEEEAQQLREAKDALEAQNADLKKKLEDALRRLAELEREEELWRQRQAAWEKERADLLAQLEALRKRNSQLEDQHARDVARLEAELAAEKEKNRALAEEFDKLRQAKLQLEKDVESESAKRKTAEDENKDLEALIRELRNERDKLQGQVAGLESNNEQLRAENQALTDELEKLRRLVDKLDDDNKKLEKERDALKSTVDRLRNKLDEAEAALAAALRELAGLKDRFEKLSNAHGALQENFSKQKQELEDEQAKVTALEWSRKALQGDLDKAKKEVDTLQDTAQRLKEEKDELQGALAKSEMDKAALQDQWSRLAREHALLKENFEKLQDDLAAAEADKARLDLEKAALQEKFDKLARTKAALQGQLDTALQEKAWAEDDLEDQKKELAALQDKFNRLMKERDDLKGANQQQAAHHTEQNIHSYR